MQSPPPNRVAVFDHDSSICPIPGRLHDHILYWPTCLILTGGLFHIYPQVPCTSSASTRLLVCSRLDVLLKQQHQQQGQDGGGHLAESEGGRGGIMTEAEEAEQLCALAGKSSQGGRENI